MWASLVAGVEHAERVERARAGSCRGSSRGMGARTASSPSRSSWRAASACAPRIRASEQVPNPSSSGHAAEAAIRRDRSPRRACSAVSASALVGRLRHAGRAGPRGPTSSGRGPRASRPARRRRPPRATSKSVPASQKVVVPGPDHLDAGEQRGRLLLLRRDRRVQRQQPVGQVAWTGNVVEHQRRGSGARSGGRACRRSRARPRSAGRRSRDRAVAAARTDAAGPTWTMSRPSTSTEPSRKIRRSAIQREDRGVLDQDHYAVRFAGAGAARAASRSRTPRADRPCSRRSRARSWDRARCAPSSPRPAARAGSARRRAPRS